VDPDFIFESGLDRAQLPIAPSRVLLAGIKKQWMMADVGGFRRIL